MKEYFPILAVTVIFVLSLGGAIVLFKFLKSSAIIKKTGYQAGGALAGFLLIYGTLFYSFDKLIESNNPPGQIIWTITGSVKKEGTSKHDGITVTHVPPAPTTPTDVSGTFRLENVHTSGKTDYPEIRVESNGYYPRTFQLNLENALIDPNKQTIKLKDDLTISKVIE